MAEFFDYTKGENVTIEGESGQKLTFVATGDYQADAALYIEMQKAADALGQWQYDYGVNKPNNYNGDCSAFTQFILGQVGVKLTWSSAQQHNDPGGVDNTIPSNYNNLSIEQKKQFWAQIPTGSVITYGVNG
jgi:hypothetical protein